MVGRFLVGFVCLNLLFSVSWLVDFQGVSCGSNFSFLCHGWQTFSGVRVAQSLVFSVMVGRLLVGFVWLNLQFSVSWQVDFQWGSCGSIFSFLCHDWQIFRGVHVAQSLVFCVMVGRLLVGFVWLNLQFCVMVGRLLVGFVWLNLYVFCVMVGRFLVGSVWPNLLFSVSWQVDFQWASCVSIFCFLCHGWQTFRGVRVAQTLVFCVMVGRLLVGFVWLNLQFSVSWLVDFQWDSCGSIFSFLCHSRQTFSGVRVAQSLVFCVMVGRFLEGFMWLNLQFSVSWSVDYQWGSCGSIFSFVSWLVDFQWGSCGSIFMFSVSWLVDFQLGQCGSIFSFLCHGWQTFSGVRVAQSLVFCVMVGRLLVGFVWLNLQFSCPGWQTFSGVRVAQQFVFCVMVGRLLVGFVWLNLQFSVSWQVDFQWGSCGSIFSFLCHGWQIFSGVRVAQSLVFCVMVGRPLVGFVWLNLQFCIMVGRLLVGFVWLNLYVFCVMVDRFLVGSVWLNLQFSVSWLVDFQCGSCGSIFSFLCHGWQTFSGLRVAQSLDFCVMVGILLVGFVLLNLLFFVSWLVDFQWGSCGSIFSFLCHGRQTFSGIRVAQSLVFCVMVGRLLVGFVWLNLQFSVSRLATFNGVRVAQSLVFCLMVGRLLVGFVRFNLQFSASWLAYFQGGSCVSIFSFLRNGWEIFSGVRVAQTLVFCVMVGRLLVGFVWPHLQFSASWLVDFQWGS